MNLYSQNDLEQLDPALFKNPTAEYGERRSDHGTANSTAPNCCADGYSEGDGCMSSNQPVEKGEHDRDNRPELKVASFSVAVNRKRSGQKTTTWYRCTAWGVVAEHAVMYLKKGSKVLIEGSGLRASAYLGKDGQPHTSLELTADRITFLDSVPLDGEGDEIPM